MGQVAEVLPSDGQQALIAQPPVVHGDDTHHLRQQIAAVIGEVIEEHLTQVALPLAVTQQQHRVGIGQGSAEAREIVGIPGGPLASDVAVMAVGEVLPGAPHPMGVQHGNWSRAPC